MANGGDTLEGATLARSPPDSSPEASPTTTLSMGAVQDALFDTEARDAALKRYKASMGSYTKAKFDVFKRELDTKDRLDGKRIRTRPRSAQQL
ncbi:hypothetical protein OIV83_005398 [Microbotryomycetes sp. JL201]|nr:hypothetical protein OIV83_005398 [Microbotryomycetes sp. JL201]